MWILRQRNVAHDDGDPNTETWYTGYEVVGWLDAISVSTTTTLEIVRYDGPEPWPLTIVDVQWCEGLDDAGAGGDTHVAMVASPTTVTLDDGTREELDALLFTP
ncbi:hypothetical protein [Demequina sp. SO4-18]|uniref:hypothetical protein n=1 Tax=Demequina sp. SO4-18 TaxID=3401026 RepID=UPI003B5B8D54